MLPRTASTSGEVHIQKTIYRDGKRETERQRQRQRNRDRSRLIESVCERERDRETYTNNQPTFTIGIMVDGVLLLLFGEILQNNVVYCCTSEDGMDGGGGELNNIFQIFTYYAAGWLVLMIRAGSYTFGVLMIFRHMCYQVLKNSYCL
jgi:hypothetical protein